MATCPKCRAHYPDDVTECEVDGEPLLPDETAKALLADLEPGQRVGEYRVEGKLGQGGFGVVYRAVHPVIGKPAAVKVLSKAFSADPQMVSRFIAEARAVNTIRNEHIIDIFSFGTLDDGRHYFVMELLEGQSLEQLIQRTGALDPALLVQIMAGVADGLDAAHEKNIVHRDLKPDNIYVTTGSGGRPVAKLLDFGVAKLLGGRSMGSHKTHTGTPVGTPLYMSPEQCLGLDIDARTDIYAFGVVCFEALAGTPPFTGDSYLGLMNQHAQAARPPVSRHRPELGPSFDEPLARMMAIIADDRPASAGEALQLLVSAAEQAGIPLETIVPLPLGSSPGVLERRAGVVPSGVVRSTGDKISGEIAEAATLADPQQSTPGLHPGPLATSGAEELPPAVAQSAADTAPGAAARGSLGLETPAPTSRTEAPETRRRSRGALWLVAAAVVVAAGIYALSALPGGTASDTLATAPQNRDADAGLSPRRQSTSAGGSAAKPDSPGDPDPTLPKEVRIEVRCEAPGAAVYRGDRRLGLAPGTFTFPRQDESQQWTVKAPRHKDLELTVDLSESRTYTVNLQPLARHPARPKYSAGEIEAPPDFD